MLAAGGMATAAWAVIPPPGTVIANTATSTQQVGATPQISNSNSVSTIVGLTPSLSPVLTKTFAAASIAIGASTSLNFHLANATGNPLQAGISFVDTLPAGLRLTAGATSSVSGAGCAATVTLTAPGTIGIAAGSMTAGTAACDIAINGVTNSAGVNQDCSTNPPAFTNGAASISAIANITNGVTNQCLIVSPVLNVVVNPVCVNDTPYVDYTVTPVGVPAPNGVTITWEKISGQTVSTLPNLPLMGRILWPGATVDGYGNPTGWPGWVFVNGSWQPVNDGLRPDIRMIFTVNPTSTVVVTYPPPTPACNPGPSMKSTLDMSLIKSISANSGTSPSGPYTVTVRYLNVSHPDGLKTDVSVVDALPAGMLLVPGSLKVLPNGGNAVALAGISGNTTLHGSGATYNTSGNTITVGFSQLAQGEWGLIEFDINIAPGVAVDRVIQNIAQVSYTDNVGKKVPPRPSNTSEFRVTGIEGVTLRGMTLPSVAPGSTVTFENLLTNNGARADTFDITLSGSTYPAGTVFKLYKPDGVTLLSDSSGNGIPDTGVVAPGGTYRIIVKAQLPNGSAGGPYSIAKNAASVSNPFVKATDADVVTTIASLCRMLLEPNNVGQVAPGGAIVYTHVLTNVGNCTETVTVPTSFLGNGTSGWTAQIFSDNPVAGGSSLVGVLDSTDSTLSSTTTITVPPGGRVLFLARVVAPVTATNGTSNTTTLQINAGNSGLLTVTDATTVVAGSTGTIVDVITGFIDPGFQRRTVWGFIGQPLYLRADAPSCNADPATIEHRTIIITGPNGEREEVNATETGPNTGMFVADVINIRNPPVMAGDNLLEGRPFDTYDIELVGCGKKISTTVTLIDPNGLVFDSRTNDPIAGATVRLVTAGGGRCTSTPAVVNTLSAGQVVPAPNVIVTGADGRFQFPLVAPGEYCAVVTPPNGYTWTSTVPFTQLPPGRNVLATGPVSGGSYGGSFALTQFTGPVILDIPVDGGLLGGLFIQKTSLRSIVEIGEFLDYSVTLKNNTGYALNQSDVLLTDTLPAGFTYVTGSARRDGVILGDPTGGAGPRLVFNIGRMNKDQLLKVTYRVRVGPGALQGDGVNHVVASYRVGGSSTLYSESNVATAKVTITGGVFSDSAYILGKVFTDCNNDGVQTAGADKREVGVPGVRLYLEDGTNVISDSEGKFSIYGLSPRTHILKIDRTTLPAGVTVADLARLSNRNLGKGDSRIVDLKNGELQKVDFAITACTEKVLADITDRRTAAAALKEEFEGRLQQKLETDPNLRAANDVKALPASGTLGITAPTANIAAPAALGAAELAPLPTIAPSRFDSLATQLPDRRTKSIVDRASREPEVLLESILPKEDNTPGFIGMKDGDVLAYAQSAIRVKGAMGTSFTLSVNGKDVPPDRVGKKAVLAEKQLQAWEFIGVNLAVGENTLVMKQVDDFGNVRAEKTIKVIAPGTLSRLIIEFPQMSKAGAVADGKTPVKVLVRLTDAHNIPVTSRTAITLSASVGRWDVEDLSGLEPGVQTFIEGGRAEFNLLPSAEPAESLLRVSSGDVIAETKVDFLPDLRELIAAGVIEGVLNLRKLDSRGLSPARAQDGFEQEITHLARTWGDGDRSAAARAAMFLKGKVKGEYLLTLAYDSDKNTRDRLFRDIQPDEFYPIYGDSSVRGFDAQSTGRFYVRVDKAKSYLLYGDFNTSQMTEARKLANYSRSLTGVKEHFESGRVSANVFASRDTTRQVIDELPANGTSGPFVLSHIAGLVNSEKIEILTRDRNQSSVIIRSVLQTRFLDYELEPLTGRILFKAPIASLDENLNPISLRITYEVDQGGDQFWVTGADAQVKVTDKFEVGAMIVDDRNPLDKFRMAGINAVARLADKTFLIAEVARTNRETFTNGLSGGEKTGNAERLEFKHASENLDVNLYAGRADATFDNASSSLTNGRMEVGGKLSYKLDEKTRIKGEFLRTEDTVAGSKRDGVMIAAERVLDNGLRLEGGIRHARESLPQVPLANGVVIPNEVTSVRARVTGDIPNVKDASAYVEAEVDVNDTSRKIAAVGADYRLGTAGKLYARYEFISSLTGPYGLNNQQRQNSTVVGISTDYMKDGNLFSEYRVRDAISGGDAEAAVGLRNLWTLADGLKMQTGFERVHALSGTGESESTAITFGLEYTANPLWKGSTRLEFRNSQQSDSILATVAAAAKLNRDWTFLGRNTYSLIRNKGLSTGENEQDRMQLGLAYRQTDNDVWNALGRIEHRTEGDTTQPGLELKRTVELISIHANWQPRRPFTFSARYAAKWVNEKSNGLPSRNNAQLLSGRAIWDVAPRWDVSVNASTLFGNGAQSKYYGLGLELGYLVMENLWISAGYNFFGYRDDDLTSGEYTSKGVFLRLRYKFDEDLFASGKQDKTANKASSAAEAITTSKVESGTTERKGGD